MTIPLKYLLMGGAVVVLIAGAVVFMSQKKPDIASCADVVPQPRIVAFGDSLVAGYGAETGQGFVDDLSSKIGIPITNLGVSGDTTEAALVRVHAVTAAKPDVVIVLVGGNDALQKKPLATTKANLEQILAAVQSTGAQIVLVAVPGGLTSDPYKAMYQELAATYHAQLVPNILSGLLGHQDLMSDSVHPNAIGYQKVADRILPAVSAECKML